MKICIECKHMERDEAGLPKTPAYCCHPESETRTLNFVTGVDAVERPSCDFARNFGACKQEGLLWEALGDPVPQPKTEAPSTAPAIDFERQLRDRLYEPKRP
jgi:hypothetical protein